jgi:hypothetical protein
MSDPKEPRHDADELELDPETVKDLDVEEKNADEIRGGTNSITFYGN